MQNHKTKYKKIQISKLFNLKLLCVILIFPFYIFNLPKAYAQTLSLSISPPLLEVMIKPGKSATQVFKITNQGDPLLITPQIIEYNEKGIVRDSQFTPEKWINLINQDITFGKPYLLESQQEKQIILRINPSKETLERDYYRALILTTQSLKPTEQAKTDIVESISAILLITVTDSGLEKQARISHFTLPKIIDSFGPIITEIELENVGQTYFRPLGSLFLSGPIGQTKFEIAPVVLLKDQYRKLDLANQSNSDKDEKITIGGFFLGKYYLKLDFTLDQGNIRISETKTVYAVPWKLISVLGILLLIYLVVRKRKETNNTLK